MNRIALFIALIGLYTSANAATVVTVARPVMVSRPVVSAPAPRPAAAPAAARPATTTHAEPAHTTAPTSFWPMWMHTSSPARCDNEGRKTNREECTQ